MTAFIFQRPRCVSACAWSRDCPKPAASASFRRAASGRSPTSPISRTVRSSTAALAGHRHAAVWDVAGVERLPPLVAGSTFAEIKPELATPTEGQQVIADYRTLGLTLRRHPLALLRRQLAQRRLATACEIAATPNGRIVRTAGLVIGRQKPDTASGVVFVTIEDETGATNIIVWRDLGDRQRRELLGARLLAVYGKVEREGSVVHVLAGRLADLTPLLGQLPTRSRDFH